MPVSNFRIRWRYAMCVILCVCFIAIQFKILRKGRDLLSPLNNLKDTPQTECNGHLIEVIKELFHSMHNSTPTKNNISESNESNLSGSADNFALRAECTPRYNLYYVKTHKTGSSTMSTLLERLVLRRGLKQVLVRRTPYPWHTVSQAVCIP